MSSRGGGMQQENEREVEYARLQQEDGYAREIRDLALNLVMQIPSAPGMVRTAPNDEHLVSGDDVTIRLADVADVEAIARFAARSRWSIGAFRHPRRRTCGFGPRRKRM